MSSIVYETDNRFPEQRLVIKPWVNRSAHKLVLTTRLIETVNKVQ